MATHYIQASEPLWVNSKQTLNEDGELDTFDSREVTDFVEEVMGEALYECTCGASFGADWGEAQEHLQDIRDSDSGEAVKPRR